MAEAMLADGSVTRRRIAEEMTDELLKYQSKYLPQF